MPVAAAHARRSRRRSALPLLIVLALVIAAAVTAVVVWQQGEREKAHRAEVAAASGELDAWSAQAGALLANPSIDLAATAGAQDAEGIAALQAECTRARDHAAAVDEATGPGRIRVPRDFPGAAPVVAQQERQSEGLAAYQSAVTDAVAGLGGFCEDYPALLEVTIAQNGALAALGEQVASCNLAEAGCLPRETEEWAAIADAMGPAYLEPARQRADLYASRCPAESQATVCALLAEQNTALVPLYELYVNALRAGDAEALETARGNLQETLTAQSEAFDQAVRNVNPGIEVADPAATFAAALAAGGRDTDAALRQAETAFLTAVG